MTVSELIESLIALQTPDAVVVVRTDRHGTMMQANVVRIRENGAYEEFRTDRYETVRPSSGTVAIDSMN